MNEVSNLSPALAAGSMISFLIVVIIYLVLMGFSVYGFILFIKLARRGIRALDIYIKKNSTD